MFTRYFAPDPPPGGAPGGGGSPPAGGTPPGGMPPGGAPPIDWRSTLGDDLKGHAALKDVPDVATLAKNYVNQQPLIGADKIVMPGKDATPEQIAAFHMKLGRPEKVEGYELPKDGLPQGFKADDARVAAMRKIAFEQGVPAKVFAALVRADAQYMDQMTQKWEADTKAAQTANVEALRKEFGSAFEERIQGAKNAVRQFGGEDLVTYLDETGLGNHPAMVKAFAAIAKAIGSDEILGGGAGAKFTMTPGEAAAAIRAHEVEFKDALTNNDHPQHKDAVARRTQLHELANPTPRK